MPTLSQNGQEPGWSPPPLLDQLQQDLGVDFVIELIHAFLDHLAATVPLVSAASAQGDLGIVAKQAHSIKGSARQLDVEIIGWISAQIETLAKENNLREVQLLTARLEEESKAVQRGFQAHLEGLSAPPPTGLAPQARK
jgi:HPt (histidine-containing phosphotransfer) domain-containing protein